MKDTKKRRLKIKNQKTKLRFIHREGHEKARKRAKKRQKASNVVNHSTNWI